MSTQERAFIFLTLEGYTYQPDSVSVEPDVENVQMLGVAYGPHQLAAFRHLVEDNPWLLQTSFGEVYCYELARDYSGSRQEFNLSTMRGQGSGNSGNPGRGACPKTL